MANIVQRDAAEAPLAGRYFCGHFTHSLDPKSRLTIPSDWRNLVGSPEYFYVVPSVGPLKHLFVYPARVMEPKLRRIHRLSMSDAKAREYLRAMGSRSEMLGWDTQGRIRIRDDLLAHAQITTVALLAGNYEGFEIWNPENWERYNRTLSEENLLEASKYVGI